VGRNAFPTPAAVALFLMQALAVSSCFPQGTRTASPERFSLAIPEQWVMERIDPPFFPTAHAYGLRYPGWREVVGENEGDYEISAYPIHVCVYDGSLRTSGNAYGWSFEDGRWWLEGRIRGEAVFTAGKRYDSLRGEPAVGLRAKPGGAYLSSVASTAFVAVIDDRKGNLVVFTSDVFFEDKALFDGIVDGIRFADE
jgi:hypothetical protein